MPLGRPSVPQGYEAVRVARLDDCAAVAADAPMAESRELGEHRPVEMDIEMAEDESGALKRHKVTALRLGVRRVNVLMQSMVVAMVV